MTLPLPPSLPPSPPEVPASGRAGLAPAAAEVASGGGWDAVHAAAEDMRRRAQFGRTVGDARRVLRRMRHNTVYLAVRVGSDEDGAGIKYLAATRPAVDRMLRFCNATDHLPCEFDPVTDSLTIGSSAAIAHWKTGEK